MKYLLLFVIPFSLYASKILSYNTYERSNHADVMISFDTPFNGVIKQSKSTNKIIIKLKDASIESSYKKKVDSDFLHAFTITPLKGQTQIVASVSPNVRLIASKTSNSYGLRLRFTNLAVTKQSTTGLNSKNSLSALPTKKNDEMSSSYYIVVTILILGIIILLVLKNKMISTTDTKQNKSWLFNSNDTQAKKEIKIDIPFNPDAMVSIRFQKVIDNQNSVVMLDFGNESYLVLMGNSNILLDKFKDSKPTSQQEFDTILQARNRELEDFLGPNQSRERYSTSQHKEPLQAYKESASTLVYTDD